MTADHTPRAILDCFVLEQIASLPLAKRTLLYRAFAAECADRDLKKRVIDLADECEAIEREHQQLVLQLQAR